MMYMIWILLMKVFYRYVVCEVNCEGKRPSFTEYEFYMSLREAVTKHHGDYGTGCIMTSLSGRVPDLWLQLRPVVMIVPLHGVFKHTCTCFISINNIIVYSDKFIFTGMFCRIYCCFPSQNYVKFLVFLVPKYLLFFAKLRW